MKKTVTKAASLSLQDLDLAVNEALQRVAQARELHEEELACVAGGLMDVVAGRIGPVRSPWIDVPTVGMWIEPSDPFANAIE